MSWITNFIKKFFNAAAVPGEFPADFTHLAKRKQIPELLRTIDNENLSDEQIGRLIAEIPKKPNKKSLAYTVCVARLFSVERKGVEPSTSALRTQRSPN